MKITGGWEGPYPDENAYSIISRLAEYVVTPDHHSSNLRLFEKYRPLAQYTVKPLKKSDLERWELPGTDSYTDHILAHSSYPVYGVMLFGKRKEELNALLRGEELMKGKEKYLTRAMHCMAIRKNALCYCPACATEDTDSYGEPYWHRLHQVPGVEVCPRHGFLLCETQATMHLINSRFIPLAYVIATEGMGECRLPDSVSASFLQQTAEDITWLMDYGLQLGGAERIEPLVENWEPYRSMSNDEINAESRQKYNVLVKHHLDRSFEFPFWGEYERLTYLHLVVMMRVMGGSVTQLL